MEDKFDAFKPTYAPESFHNWNVEDLKDYQQQLTAKISELTKFCQQNRISAHKQKPYLNPDEFVFEVYISIWLVRKRIWRVYLSGR